MSRLVIEQATRFALVGGLGTITNLTCFFLMVDLGGVSALPGATIAFAIAVTQNYVLNELWTFNPHGSNRVSRGRYAKFVSFSMVALGVNLLVLKLLLDAYSFPLKVVPQAIGILCATGVNFVASRFITFR